MTDAGEKLEQRVITFFDLQPHCIGYPGCDGNEYPMADEGTSHEPGCPLFGKPEPKLRDQVVGCIRAELERAAEIADYYAKQMFGEKVDAEDLAVEIATAIRKLKE